MIVENANDVRPVTTMQDYRTRLRDVTAIQAETVRRLIDGDTPPLEMAAVLEDIANKFLDMSDEVREYGLSLQEVPPEVETCSREEDLRA